MTILYACTKKKSGNLLKAPRTKCAEQQDESVRIAYTLMAQGRLFLDLANIFFKLLRIL